MTLNGTTGASISVSGTPTAVGPYAYAIKVSDRSTPNAQTASQSYSGTALPAPTILTLNCTPTTGPTQVGVAYSATCTAAGGLAPYSWSVSSGALPAGITLSGTAESSIISSGTPAVSAQGNYSYTISVADSTTPVAQTAPKSFAGSIAPPAVTLALSCTPATGPTQVGVAYSGTCTATGGTPPYNWSITGGALPAGLSLSSTTGSAVTIGGRPIASGLYNYTVTVRDTTTPTAQTANSGLFTGNVLQPTTLSLTCTPTTGPAAIGAPYSAACTVSGGSSLYGWSVSGTLPAGLSLSATTGASVTVSGAPTVAGNYSYTIKVTDSGTPPQTASQPYSGAILSAISVSPVALTFTYQSGATVPSQQVSVKSSTSGVPFTVAVGSGCSSSGISATPAGGTTPGTITVSANPAGLSPGTYNCSMVVSGGGATQSVFVTFTVGGSIQVSPSSLIFSYVAGGQTPAAQSLAVSGNGPFTASPGCTWATVNPASGTAPASLSVSVNPAGLAQATYTCAMTVSGPGAANSQQVAVRLVVSPPPAVPPTVTPQSLSLATPQSNNTPVKRTFTVTGPDTPVAFTAVATTASGGPWLSVDPTSASTPATVELLLSAPVGGGQPMPSNDDDQRVACSNCALHRSEKIFACLDSRNIHEHGHARE